MEENQVSDQKIVSDENQDKVSYETYKKVVSQRKSDKAKMAEFETKVNELTEKLSYYEAEKAKIDETKNLEANNWKAVLEAREKKINELSEKVKTYTEENEGYKSELNNMVKLSSFSNMLGGKLKKQDYYKFVDVEKIAIDPETKRIDSDSLKSYVDEFKNQYKELIDFGDKKKLPNEAATNNNKFNLASIEKKDMKNALENFIGKWE
jgi:chromosome segregation ATPase